MLVVVVEVLGGVAVSGPSGALALLPSGPFLVTVGASEGGIALPVAPVGDDRIDILFLRVLNTGLAGVAASAASLVFSKTSSATLAVLHCSRVASIIGARRCGWASADSAMKMMWRSQASLSLRLETMPL